MAPGAEATVWVFTGAGASFPGGVFSSRNKAEDWIGRNRLSGTLTEYPLDEGAYDWAVRVGFFAPKPSQTTGSFIGSFTSGRQHHAHFEDGRQVA